MEIGKWLHYHFPRLFKGTSATENDVRYSTCILAVFVTSRNNFRLFVYNLYTKRNTVEWNLETMHYRNNNCSSFCEFLAKQQFGFHRSFKHCNRYRRWSIISLFAVSEKESCFVQKTFSRAHWEICTRDIESRESLNRFHVTQMHLLLVKYKLHDVLIHCFRIKFV